MIINNIIYNTMYNIFYDNILCIMNNVFAWTRVAASEHPVQVDPANLIIVFKMTRPKPAYGRQGLDWIARPEYSFMVFSM